MYWNQHGIHQPLRYSISILIWIDENKNWNKHHKAAKLKYLNASNDISWYCSIAAVLLMFHFNQLPFCVCLSSQPFMCMLYSNILATRVKEKGTLFIFIWWMQLAHLMLSLLLEFCLHSTKCLIKYDYEKRTFNKKAAIKEMILYAKLGMEIVF